VYIPVNIPVIPEDKKRALFSLLNGIVDRSLFQMNQDCGPVTNYNDCRTYEGAVVPLLSPDYFEIDNFEPILNTPSSMQSYIFNSGQFGTKVIDFKKVWTESEKTDRQLFASVNRLTRIATSGQYNDVVWLKYPPNAKKKYKDKSNQDEDFLKYFYLSQKPFDKSDYHLKPSSIYFRNQAQLYQYIWEAAEELRNANIDVQELRNYRKGKDKSPETDARFSRFRKKTPHRITSYWIEAEGFRVNVQIPEARLRVQSDTVVRYFISYGPGFKQHTDVKIVRYGQIEQTIKNSITASRYLEVMNDQTLLCQKMLLFLVRVTSQKAVISGTSFFISSLEAQDLFAARMKIYAMLVDKIESITTGHCKQFLIYTLRSYYDRSFQTQFWDVSFFPQKMDLGQNYMQISEKFISTGPITDRQKLFEKKVHQGRCFELIHDIRNNLHKYVNVQKLRETFSHPIVTDPEFYSNTNASTTFFWTDEEHDTYKDCIEKSHNEILTAPAGLIQCKYKSVQSWLNILEFMRERNITGLKLSDLMMVMADVSAQIHLFQKDQLTEPREVSILDPLGKLVCGIAENMMKGVSLCMKGDFICKEPAKEKGVSKLIGRFKEWNQDDRTTKPDKENRKIHNFFAALDAKGWNQRIYLPIMSAIVGELLDVGAGVENSVRGNLLRAICLWYAQKNFMFEVGKLEPLMRYMSLLLKPDIFPEKRREYLNTRNLRKETFIEKYERLYPKLERKYPTVIELMKSLILDPSFTSEDQLKNLVYSMPLPDGMSQGILGITSSVMGSIILRFILERCNVEDFRFMITSDDMLLLLKILTDEPWRDRSLLLKEIFDKLAEFGILLSVQKCIFKTSEHVVFNSNLYSLEGSKVMEEKRKVHPHAYQINLSPPKIKVHHLPRQLKALVLETFTSSPLEGLKLTMSALTTFSYFYQMDKEFFIWFLGMLYESSIVVRQLKRFDIGQMPVQLLTTVPPPSRQHLPSNSLFINLYLKFRELHPEMSKFVEIFGCLLEDNSSIGCEIIQPKFHDFLTRANYRRLVKGDFEERIISPNQIKYAKDLMKRLKYEDVQKTNYLDYLKTAFQPFFQRSIGTFVWYGCRNIRTSYDINMMKQIECFYSEGPKYEYAGILIDKRIDYHRKPTIEYLIAAQSLSGTIPYTLSEILQLSRMGLIEDEVTWTERPVIVSAPKNEVTCYGTIENLPKDGESLIQYTRRENKLYDPWILPQERRGRVWIKIGAYVSCGYFPEHHEVRIMVVQDRALLDGVIFRRRTKGNYEPVVCTKRELIEYLAKFHSMRHFEKMESEGFMFNELANNVVCHGNLWVKGEGFKPRSIGRKRLLVAPTEGLKKRYVGSLERFAPSKKESKLEVYDEEDADGLEEDVDEGRYLNWLEGDVELDFEDENAEDVDDDDEENRILKW